MNKKITFYAVPKVDLVLRQLPSHAKSLFINAAIIEYSERHTKAVIKRAEQYLEGKISPEDYFREQV